MKRQDRIWVDRGKQEEEAQAKSYRWEEPGGGAREDVTIQESVVG